MYNDDKTVKQHDRISLRHEKNILLITSIKLNKSKVVYQK